MNIVNPKPDRVYLVPVVLKIRAQSVPEAMRTASDAASRLDYGRWLLNSEVKVLEITEQNPQQPQGDET